MKSVRVDSPTILRCLLTSLGMLLAIEIGVRLVGIAPPLTRPPLFTSDDPYLPWKPIPRSVVVGGYGPGEYSYVHAHNSLGFRDEEHSFEKAPGTFRILGLGDSFMYGAGADYEDTLLVVLEKLLNSRLGRRPKVEIIKAGISRYFATPERKLLEGYGPSYKPDLILLGFNINDIGDAVEGEAAVTIDSSGYMTTKEAKRVGSTGRFLYMYSHFFRTVWDLAVTQPLAFQHGVDFLEVIKGRGRYESSWKELEDEYLRMDRFAKSINSKLVITYLPSRQSWKDEHNYVEQRLKGFAKSNGIPYLDILTELRLLNYDDLFWKIDNHPNGAGYRKMAEILFQRIESEGLIPP
jgi:lysophospholipase L1-like esterase